MLDGLIWHGTGVLCVIAIVALVWNIAKQRHVLTRRIFLISFLVGLLAGILGTLLFYFLFIFIVLSLRITWLLDISHEARLYLMIFICFLVAFINGKANAYVLRKYLPGNVIFSSTVIIWLLFILQPIGYGWLKLIGIVH